MKKLLALMLSLCLLASLLFVFAACDSSSSKRGGDDDDDDDGDGETVMTNPPTTSEGPTITEEEWVGMLNSTNVTIEMSGYMTVKIQNGNSEATSVYDESIVTYYTVKKGVAYEITVEDGEVVEVEETELEEMTIGGCLSVFDILESDYNSLVYDEEEEEYCLEKDGYDFYFGFVDGVIQYVDLDYISLTFTDYGTTTVNVPSFSTPDDEESDTANSSKPAPSTGSEISYSDWASMLNTSNCYIYGEEDEHYYVMANDAIESPSSIIARKNGHTYIFIKYGSDWEYASQYDEFGGINLNWLFFQGKATADDYYTLSYDNQNECYTYHSMYKLYFDNGELWKLEMDGTVVWIADHGLCYVDVSDLPFPKN